jgi:hypothetical protein
MRFAKETKQVVVVYLSFYAGLLLGFYLLDMHSWFFAIVNSFGYITATALVFYLVFRYA